MIRMKSLRQFRGRKSEGRDGLVKPGREFTVSDTRRADDLERVGLAVRVDPVSTPATFMSPAEVRAAESPAPSNPAADTGPLPSAGGETGETEQDASFSPAAPAQPDATFDPPETEDTSSPSTSHTGSRRGRKPYTRATEDGGGRGKGSQRSKD